MLVMHARSRFTLFLLMSGIMIGALVATPALAQTPKTHTACFVPSSGTVYRNDKPAGTAPGSPAACSSSKRGADVEFTLDRRSRCHPTHERGRRRHLRHVR